MKATRSARAALLALMLLCPSAAFAGEDAPYPIWWSPELGLESLEDIGELLDESFPENRQFDINLNRWERLYTVIPGTMEEGRPRYEKRTDGREFPAQHIANCRNLIEWSDRRYEPTDFDVGPIFAHYSAYCYALNALNTAKPARMSYLHDFKFDDEAMDFIPTMIGEFWWCGRLDVFLEANREGVPWGKFPYRVKGLGERMYRLSVLFS